ncbi:MAG: DUF1294 domain-containing protein [Firmicutes bacterium]|nr:DUF1294 domain-containing protein [Bacillota bacterium]
MQRWQIILIVYLLLINLIGAGLVVSDKKRARQNRWRIRERSLFLAAALGGCPGVYLTMKKIRHKTQHKRFMIGLPLIFALQLLGTGAAYWFYFR